MSEQIDRLTERVRRIKAAALPLKNGPVRREALAIAAKIEEVIEELKRKESEHE